MEHVQHVFEACKAHQRGVFVAFVTCGYPKRENTVSILLALQSGGADIIELGVPFSDPQADGPTIQRTHEVGVQQGITIQDCVLSITAARGKGLTVPVLLMGYLNTFMQYGLERTCHDLAQVKGNGLIIVDLPPKEAQVLLLPFVDRHHLCYIPFIAPTTSLERMKVIASVARGFVYCVRVTGVTGSSSMSSSSDLSSLPTDDMPRVMTTVRTQVGDCPVVIGFGLSSREQIHGAAEISDGAVVGSKIIRVIDEANDMRSSSMASIATAVQRYCESVSFQPPQED